MKMKNTKKDEMFVIAKDKIFEKYKEIRSQVFEEIDKKYTNTVYYEELKRGFLDACEKCALMQSKGRKKEIMFVGVHFLKSSMITGTYDLYINFYDNRLYGDRIETYGIWKPQTIMSHYEELAQVYEKNIRQKVIRPLYSEIQDMKMQLYGDFLKIAEGVVRAYAFDLINLPEFITLNHQNEYALFFSAYMELGRPFCSWKKNMT